MTWSRAKQNHKKTIGNIDVLGICEAKKQYFDRRVAKVEINELIGPGRRRRLFAHVLGNIDGVLSWEAPREVEFEPKPLFLKRSSVVANTSLEAEVGSPETVRLWQKHDV